MQVNVKLCRSCGLKIPSYGLANIKKKWWCHACAQTHLNAVSIHKNVCEDCLGTVGVKWALGGETRPRWCSKCKDLHPGATVRRTYCSICKKVRARFALPVDIAAAMASGRAASNAARWCGGCVKKNPAETQGAVNVGMSSIHQHITTIAPDIAFDTIDVLVFSGYCTMRRL